MTASSPGKLCPTRRFPGLRLCCLLLPCALGGQLADATEIDGLARVELPDQQGRLDSVAAHRDRVTVVMVVTARRLRNLKDWQKELQRRFDGVDFVLIADVPADPPVTYDRVVEKLGRRIPEEVSVLIDLERRWATGLGLDTERPNLLLFDRGGRLAASFRGRSESALVEEVSRALAALAGS